MAEIQQLIFDILTRDRASEGFAKAGHAAQSAAGDVSTLTRKLDEVGQKSVRARVALAGNKEALAQLDAFDAKLVGLDRRTGTGRVTVEGAARALADISAVDLALDKLGRKDVTPKITVLMDKASKLGFLQPSGIGAALASLPALIPLAGSIAGAVGAIGISFGAATIGAGLFGLAATSVLSQASSDAQKLTALNAKLATAQTAAQRKAARQQIEALTIGWAKGYANLIGQYQDFHQKWKAASQAIAVPALTTWLGALTKGLPLLVTAVKPVADVFQNWGQILKDNFSSPAIMKNLQGMAAAFGRFSAGQLTLLGGAIADIALGVFHLGKDLAGSGANFSSFGIWLNNIGSGFLTWSKSAKARADVQGFLHYLHTEGPVVRGILSSLGKILPGIFAGATATGNLELKAIGGLLSLVAKLPKGWQGPLTEAAGALLLLSKTGVLKVGFTVVGAAAGWVKKLIGGASVDLGAAGMQTAGDTMLTAAGAMQKAADTMVGADAAGGGAARAGGAAAGAGAGAAEGGTMAALGAASVPVAVGIISGVAIAQLVNNDAASKASQAIASRVMKKNNLTPADIAAGKQTGGVVPGVPKSAIGSWQEYGHAVKGAAGDQVTWNKNAGLGKQAADTLSASVAAMRDRNKQLSVTFRNGLIADLNTMHANTPKVRTDVSNLAASILNTGNRSAATRGDRQKLITDLENAGVNAKTATGFVNGLQKKIDAMHGKTVKVGVTETGVGHFTIAQVSSLSRPGGKLAGPLGSAAGRLVTGGVPGRDSVLLAAMPGEVVVPTHMVKGGAVDHLRGMIPGFASGGYVGSPAGMLGSFTSAQESSFQAHVTSAMKSAMTAALRKSIRQAATFAGGLGKASLRQIEDWWMGAGGPGGGTAHVAAAITGAESGFNPRAVQAGQPYATTGWGLWQITPGNSEPQAGIDGQLLNGPANARAAVAKYRGAGGFSPWTTFMDGAYLRFMDRGGWLPPGPSLVYNGTGAREHLTPDGGGSGSGTQEALLAEIADTLASIDANTASAPHLTGRAVTDTLNGAARSSVYSSMYGSR